MKHSMKSLVSLLLCGIVVLSSWASPVAAQESQLVVIVDEIDTSRYQDERIIQAYVTVRHPQEGGVEGLTADDFTLRISDGARLVPDSAEMETGKVSLAIVLDLYQTMRRDNGFENAKDAVSNLCLNQKALEDRVAVFGVRQGVDPDSESLDTEYEHEFTTDGGAVANFVQDLEMVNTPPGTPLYDTIIKAMRYTVQVSEEPVGRRGIIVITDGGDRESRNDSDVVIEAARNLRIPVYTIGYTGRSSEEDEKIRFLNGLAQRTGGAYRNTPDSEQFDEFLGELREEMTKRYVLTLSVDDFETSRQILDVRVDYNDMVGSDSLKFDVDVESTPTPEPVDVTATPSDEADGEDGDDDEGDGEDQTLMEWVEDNVLYVAIGGGLLLLLLIAAIVLVSKRKKSTPPGGDSPPYTPPADDWGSPSDDWGGQPGGGATIPGAGEAADPTQMGDGGGWSDDAGAWGGETAAGTPTPYQDETEFAGGPAPGFDRPQPASPPGPGGAPRDGSTVILSHGPKMEHEALLIDRRAQRNYELTRPEMRLGRAAENEIKLDSEKISRRHALVMLEGDTFYIQDLGSANGTFVNGKQVRERVALHTGDEVRLGDQILLFNQLS